MQNRETIRESHGIPGLRALLPTPSQCMGEHPWQSFSTWPGLIPSGECHLPRRTHPDASSKQFTAIYQLNPILASHGWVSLDKKPYQRKAAKSKKLQTTTTPLWRVGIYPTTTNTSHETSLITSHEGRTHAGTNCPKGHREGHQTVPFSHYSSVSSQRVQQCEAFVRCLWDDESIEFDNTINIEECAH